MRMWLALALSLPSLAACSQATTLLTSIESASGAALQSLSAEVMLAAPLRSGHTAFPAPIGLPQSLLVELPDAATLVTVTLDATTADGRALMTTKSIESQPHHRVTLDLVLDSSVFDDGGIPSDLNIPCVADADVCGDTWTLLHCRSDGSGFDATACPLGCGAAPKAHCQSFVPSLPVTPADLDGSNLGAISINANATLHSDSGAIDGVRPANGNANTLEVHNGIAFHLQDGVGIFSFGGLTLAAGATLLLVGNAPVALVSSGDLTIAGVVDARGTCAGTSAGPGGSVGGAAGVVGQGAGAGDHGTKTTGDDSGGGGAGHGDVGGPGGTTAVPPGAPGVIYDVATLVPLRGGSGGGGGGEAGGGPGGGGGGAVQLVAAGVITISSNGGVNAGGCGGGLDQATNGDDGAGGGGSGGAILVEAPTIHVAPNGALAANGGAGGGSGSTAPLGTSGSPGALGATRAGGGSGSSGSGGRGGATGATSGETGTHGGGGGGGVGRIRLSTRSGAATLDAAAILSPGANDLNAQGQPMTTQGIIGLQ